MERMVGVVQNIHDQLQRPNMVETMQLVLVNVCALTFLQSCAIQLISIMDCHCKDIVLAVKEGSCLIMYISLLELEHQKHNPTFLPTLTLDLQYQYRFQHVTCV